MIELTQEELKQHFSEPIFGQIAESADALGLECYVVGGYVRDIFLQRPSKDIDVVVVGSGIAMAEALGKRLGRGAHVSVFKNFGTAQVKYKGTEVEFVGARKESYHRDSRKPIVEDGTLEDDQNRRDFTINAMAYNEEQGLVDLFGGIQDLTDRIIRCVGNPAERFDEDALRMLRAVRFAGQLNFKIEENTKAAIEAQHIFLKDVSAERIQTELMKLLVSGHPEMIRTAYETGLTSVFLPEFDRMMETPQNNPHHIYSVGDHTVHAVETIAPNPVLRLTMLLHDIAKPETRTTDENGIDHFYNHNAVGADLAKAALKRLKFDNQTTHMVTTLIANHDIRFNDPLGTGRKHVRKIIHRVGADHFPYLLDVMEADISAQSDFMRLKKLTALKETREAYREILTANDCLTLKDLKINGNQLKALGISEGKMIGAILNALLAQVLNNPELNEYEKLEELALKIYQEVQ